LLQEQKKTYVQINAILCALLCAENKSSADFPRMKQLIKNDEKDAYTTLKEVMEVGIRQYEQLNNK